MQEIILFFTGYGVNGKISENEALPFLPVDTGPWTQ